VIAYGKKNSCESSFGPWVPDLRSRTQVAFTRLAHLKLPISGKPEIGALARPGHENIVSRASGAKRSETRDPAQEARSTILGAPAPTQMR